MTYENNCIFYEMAKLRIKRENLSINDENSLVGFAPEFVPWLEVSEDGNEFCLSLVFLGGVRGTQGLMSNLTEFSQAPELHELSEAKEILTITHFTFP